MSKLKGTNIASPIVPYTDSDIYPTHQAKYGKGGYRTVQNYEELINISAPRLEEGMLAYLIEEYHGHHFYQYKNGGWVLSDIENDNTLLFNNPDDKEYETEIIGDSIKIRNEIGEKITEEVPEPGQFNFIKINSFYLGKYNSSSSHDFLPCSHKFIELSNVSANEVSLDGLYLMVYSGDVWRKLKLTGIIPPGRTYLIRGEQCSTMNSSTTYIKVKEFNQEWDDGMTRESSPYTIYLCWCNEDGEILTEGGVFKKYPDQRSDIYYEYNPSFIDCVSLGQDNTYSDGKSIEEPDYYYDTYYKIFIRRYPMDPDYVDTLDNRIDWRWHRITSDQYRPAATYENKNIDWGTKWMRQDKPLTLTCTVGEYSHVETKTPDGMVHPASRCFTWVSSSAEDEYLFIRAKGSENWGYFASFVGNSREEMLDNTVHMSLPTDQWKTMVGAGEEGHILDDVVARFYNRCQWETITGTILVTHRVIIYCIEAGEYEYCCGKLKDGAPDPEYVSDIQSIRVSHVSDNTGKLIVIGNQFISNQEDGEGWFITSSKLYTDTVDQKYEFVLCTGNMVGHGNRPGEWVEYINNNTLGKHYAEFITPGTNDMGSTRLYELDSKKISPVMFNLFYTFELPESKYQQVRREGSYLDTDNAFEEGTIILPGFYFTYFGNKVICSINSAISSSSFRESTAKEVYKLVDEEYLSSELVPWSTVSENGRSTEDITISSSMFVAIVNWLINVYSYFLTGEIRMTREPDDNSRIYDWLLGTSVIGADYNKDKLLKARRFIILTNYPPIEPKSSQEEKYDRMGESYIEDNFNTRLSFALSRLFKCLNLHHIFGSSSYASTLISRPIFDAQGRYSRSKFTIMDTSGGPTGVNEFLIDYKDNQMTPVDTFSPVVGCYDLTTAANLATGEKYNRFINDSSEEITLSPTRSVGAKSELDLGDNGYTTLYYINLDRKAEELGQEGIRVTVFPNYYLLGTTFTKFTLGDKNFSTIDSNILGKGLKPIPGFGTSGWFNSFATLEDNCKPTAIQVTFSDRDDNELVDLRLVTCDLGTTIKEYLLNNYWNSEMRNRLGNTTVTGSIPVSAV